jgi:hypothetical protein
VKRYLILEVGCLECGGPTEIVGWSDTVPKEAILVTWHGDYKRDDWCGDVVTVAVDTESIPT